MNKKKILSWILFLSWIVIIFLFSHQNGTSSSGLSNGLLEFIESIIHIPLTSDIFSLLIRKLAHFTEYFILGILTINLIKNYKAISKKEILYATFFCVLYAITDEFHQMFIGGRSPGLLDVLIDSLGSFTGIVLFYFIIRKNMQS